MKGKFYFWGFAVFFVLLAQILAYYANPANFPVLEALVTKPLILAYNIIIFIAVVTLMILLLLQIPKEDKHEKEKAKREQDARDQKLIEAFKTAFKEALREDRVEKDLRK